MASTPVSAAPVQLWGTAELRAESLADLPQWRRVLARSAAEADSVRRCLADPARCPSRPTADWSRLLAAVAGLPTRSQIEAVHRLVNRQPYRADADNYGRSDYWATPLEFFRRSGDCEDYVIAKYRSLRLLGLPAERLRMVVVQDVVRDLPHAVLAVYLAGQVLILDNLSEAVLAQESVGHYVPFYSVNETARWTHLPAAAGVAASGLAGVQPAQP
jgi:predicted transglutaminase-like cysteine proteinase